MSHDEIYLRQFPKGSLIQEKDLTEKVGNFPLTWQKFFGPNGQFISYGYLGQQNKGMGWLMLEAKEIPTPEFFQVLFLKALRKRKFLKEDATTTCYRLFNGAGDGLGGMTAEIYGGYVVFSWYNTTIYQLKKELVASFVKAYEEFFGVAPLGLIEKNRFNPAPCESQNIGETLLPESLIVYENSLAYRVYLDEGLMTGIFLDQREVRKSLSTRYGKNKRVLNTFSYTGAFSVAAKAGGAKSTTSVDLAKRSRKKTEEQFLANHFSLENEKIYVMDIFDYFSYAEKKQLNYDLIVLDPPSFARNKKKTFSVSKNYHELVSASLSLMEEGLLVCSTNAAQVSYGQFKKMIEETFRKEKRDFKLVETFRLPADFPAPKELPEENYLKVLLFEVFPNIKRKK